MELNAELKRKKFFYELRDMLAGAAFPLMLQLIFSASIILFADYSNDFAIQLVALVFGELLLVGAYIIFGRQSGLTGYRRTVQYAKKRELLSDDENAFYTAAASARKGNANDIKAFFKTGEYSLYKGFVIGLISAVPFILFQFINCVAPNTVCEFILKYAFGWAYYPFSVIGEFSEWLNFIWIVFPVCIHGAAYFWGAKGEMARQQKVREAQELKDKRRR